MRLITLYLLAVLATLAAAVLCAAAQQWVPAGIATFGAALFLREMFYVHPAEQFFGPRL